MSNNAVNRRSVLGSGLALLTSFRPSISVSAWQAREAGAYLFELPPKSTLLAVILFLGETPVELTVSSTRRTEALRGRFQGKRLAEVSWKNGTSDVERIQLMARTIADNRELPWAGVRLVAEQHLFVGFGRRSRPDEPTERVGGYPHDAVFVGFIVYGD